MNRAGESEDHTAGSDKELGAVSAAGGEEGEWNLSAAITKPNISKERGPRGRRTQSDMIQWKGGGSGGEVMGKRTGLFT